MDRLKIKRDRDTVYYCCVTCDYITDDISQLEFYNEDDYYCPLCGEDIVME